MEGQNTNVTPKDFFLWAGAMLALYVGIFNYIGLVWARSIASRIAAATSGAQPSYPGKGPAWPNRSPVRESCVMRLTSNSRTIFDA